jgi:Peptidase A4 family
MRKKTVALTAAGSALLVPLVGTMAAGTAEAQSAGTPHTTATAKTCAATAATAIQTHVNPSAVSALATGGRSYSYDLGQQQLRFAIPPAGFKPLTASAAQLAAYGLPPRPTNAADLASWTKLMSHLTTLVAPDISVSAAQHNNLPQRPSVQAGGQAGVSTGSTNIWSGYVSKESGSTYYNDVFGEWVQPSISATSCSGATHLSWVGLGGYGTAKLIQDGTNQSNQAWYEYLGAGGTGVSITLLPASLGIHSGDTIAAWTSYSAGTAYWTVEDVTNGKASSASLSSASSFYDGSSAEFIDERTTFGTTPSPLADYSATDWTSASAEITSTGYKDALSSLTNVTQLTMVNPGTGHTLATALNEGSNGYTFQTAWKNCS